MRWSRPIANQGRNGIIKVTNHLNIWTGSKFTERIYEAFRIDGSTYSSVFNVKIEEYDRKTNKLKKSERKILR